jgi:hypothetical protein
VLLCTTQVRSAVRLEKGKAVKVYELLMSCGWLPQAPGGAAPADSARGGSHDTGASASEDEGEEQQPWQQQQQQQKQQPAQEQSQQQEAQQGVGTAAGAEAPAA